MADFIHLSHIDWSWYIIVYVELVSYMYIGADKSLARPRRKQSNISVRMAYLFVKFQYDIYLLLCVQCYTPDDGQRYCPKHVVFYCKNASRCTV